MYQVIEDGEVKRWKYQKEIGNAIEKNFLHGRKII